MKKNVITFFFLLWTIFSFAQSETAKPAYGIELDRKITLAIIEEKTYENVIVELKSAEINEIFAEGVKVTVKDAQTGKIIYKKRFSKSYLYGFSDGSIQVGRGNVLTQVILYKSKEHNVWLMEIRKKGIY